MNKSQKIKVLVVGDEWVKTNDLVKAVEQTLQGYQYEMDCFDVIMDKPMSRDRKEDIGDDSITEYCGHPQALIERIDDVNLLVVHTAPVTKQVIEAGKKLIAIGCCRSDAVSVNIQAATEKGIYFFNAPGRSVEPVSDLTIAFTLLLGRNIIKADQYVKAGRWDRDINRENPIWDEFVTFRGVTFKNKKFGLVGFGKIGKRVAEKAAGLGMKVMVYDPFVEEALLAKYTKVSSLPELFANSDFISVHIPPLPENKGVIGRELLGRMKPTAYFINVARGEIIDEAALIEALQQKQIAGAALDVYYTEPLPSTSPLLKLDNVILTPHLAGQRVDVSAGSAELLAERMQPFFQESSLQTCFNSKEIEKRKNSSSGR
ncbi:d-isomer specific 2-hydroxyacid dehydrogenases signature 3 [Lucifera butyrica]|uniref:D-isomer specific 2-hydroxyacid dehydrogenases signature 3 n=1 Tax=Lucifera butyrica TaxID=1351585 RepID=A0A498R8L2_9FIRM|nr:2-hydroxyacid dehydrogenase [Lucifera butyrica]VBB07267.1 d-isomer specific 2-hydroxyacid dehydrogenases signature 3 [Lucifera butyrica]